MGIVNTDPKAEELRKQVWYRSRDLRQLYHMTLGAFDNTFKFIYRHPDFTPEQVLAAFGTDGVEITTLLESAADVLSKITKKKVTSVPAGLSIHHGKDGTITVKGKAAKDVKTGLESGVGTGQTVQVARAKKPLTEAMVKALDPRATPTATAVLREPKKGTVDKSKDDTEDKSVTASVDDSTDKSKDSTDKSVDELPKKKPKARRPGSKNV